jgi:photosystem II stability/assembly factor-like uncharacterized protein
MNVQKKRILNRSVRVGLFTLILSVGTLATLALGETPGLALADLSEAPVQVMTTGAHRNVQYAVMNGRSQPNGIYRSDDNGRTWQVISSWPGAAINTLTTDPFNGGIVYAGTTGGPLGTTNNVWRSKDGGRTWHNFNLSLPANPTRMVPAVTVVATDPNQPKVLYVGTDGQGVYRFDLDRLGYELVGGLSLIDAHIKGLVVAPDSRLYALTPTGLFVTAGEAWQKLGTVPEEPITLAVAPDNPQVLYAGAPTSGAYRSMDGGQTWERISDGLGLIPGAALRVTALVVDERDAKHLVAATAYGIGSHFAPAAIYESHNAGQQWVKLAEVDSLVHELTINDGIILAATADGLLHYGEPVKTAPAAKLASLRSLAKPTGIQVLILVLTISLAGLALVGRIEWMVRRGHFLL